MWYNPPMKICCDCNRELPLTDFYVKKRKTGVFPFARCKSCQIVWQKSKTEPAKHSVYRNRSKQRALEAVEQLKAQPCTDCGKSYPPYIMDFDHVKEGKFKAVSRMVGRNSLADVLAEIDKCELVCSNCHRERTYQRRLTAV